MEKEIRFLPGKIPLSGGVFLLADIRYNIIKAQNSNLKAQNRG